VRVWDIENEGWRSIPVDRIVSVTSEEYLWPNKREFIITSFDRNKLVWPVWTPYAYF
jgi:hypothetical protein